MLLISLVRAQEQHEFVLIVDSANRLQGILNSGDILRIVAQDMKLNSPVSQFMNKDPITASISDDHEHILSLVRSGIPIRTSGRKTISRFVPLLDSNGIVKDIADIYSILDKIDISYPNVEIYGLGFVGLTLSVILSLRGYNVIGIDVLSDLVQQLSRGVPHIHETNLESMLRQALDSGKLSFSTSSSSSDTTHFIVTVGSPIDDHGNADLQYIESVISTIASRLQPGNTIIFRSTLPVGTSRRLSLRLESYLASVQARTSSFVLHLKEP